MYCLVKFEFSLISDCVWCLMLFVMLVSSSVHVGFIGDIRRYVLNSTHVFSSCFCVSILSLHHLHGMADLQASVQNVDIHTIIHIYDWL